MDSFYAAVHQRDDPSLRGKPVVIGGSPEGRGVVAAASYEARAFGVRSAMPAARAVRLCPRAIFIRPDFTRYRQESQRIFAIFHDFTDLVQPVSIDEAFLDVTDSFVPWRSATGVAQEIRRRVRDEVGLTVSVGVGPNRLIAKIASDFDKPDGLTVVPPRRAREFLAPLPVRSLPGVGPATERKLTRVGLTTVGELRAVPVDELVTRLGSYGRRLYDYARAIDERPVRVDRERKSLSSERTYAEDIVDPAAMRAELDKLAAEVGRGLEKRGISACTITLKARYPDFTTVSRSRTLPAPTRDERKIAALARDLLARTDAGERSVRLLGVGASNLVQGAADQLELFEP